MHESKPSPELVGTPEQLLFWGNVLMEFHKLPRLDPAFFDTAIVFKPYTDYVSPQFEAGTSTRVQSGHYEPESPRYRR